MNDRRKTTAANRRLAKKRVQCLNGALCFVSSSVQADSLVLRNPLLRQAPKRWQKFYKTELMKNNLNTISILFAFLSIISCAQKTEKINTENLYSSEKIKDSIFENVIEITDRNIETGKYNYRRKQIDFNGNFEYFSLNNEVVIGTPERFSLSQNYPNPFNPSTNINYDLPFDSKVSIKIFDMSGREVASVVNEFKTAGFYTVNFNASALSSGVYFYIINADNFTATKKMILVK